MYEAAVQTSSLVEDPSGHHSKQLQSGDFARLPLAVQHPLLGRSGFLGQPEVVTSVGTQQLAQTGKSPSVILSRLTWEHAYTQPAATLSSASAQEGWCHTPQSAPKGSTGVEGCKKKFHLLQLVD